MQINPLNSDEQAVTITPATGVSIISNKSFIRNGIVYLNVVFSKSSDFTAYETIATVTPKPYDSSVNAYASGAFADTSNITKCALYGYVKSSDGSIVVTPQSGVTVVRRASFIATYIAE